MKKSKILVSLILCIVMMFSLCSCAKKTPVAEISMADGTVIYAELYPEIAPITVENFINLANDGFYDGITVHRVVPGFVIQAGDPEGTGMGGSGKNIKGEFSANGVENNLSHKRGVISMARGAYSMDSASSQFFIVHKDSTYLDGDYAAFGRVTQGMDVVDKIATETEVYGGNGEVMSYHQPVITSIKIVD